MSVALLSLMSSISSIKLRKLRLTPGCLKRFESVPLPGWRS